MNCCDQADFTERLQMQTRRPMTREQSARRSAPDKSSAWRTPAFAANADTSAYGFSSLFCGRLWSSSVHACMRNAPFISALALPSALTACAQLK